mgnify:CR=1 FL=1
MMKKTFTLWFVFIFSISSCFGAVLPDKTDSGGGYMSSYSMRHTPHKHDHMADIFVGTLMGSSMLAITLAGIISKWEEVKSYFIKKAEAHHRQHELNEMKNNERK